MGARIAPHPHESAGRFTPIVLKGRLRRSTASVFLPQRREGRRGSLRPRQIDRASCEASATINSQLQAKRICARARSAEKLGTINCDVVALAHSISRQRALARPFVSSVPCSLRSASEGAFGPFSRVFAHLSCRWVTCHLQARRQACTARVKRSETLPYRLTTRSLHSPATLPPRSHSTKPSRGVKNTAGGERSVTPGNQGTR